MVAVEVLTQPGLERVGGPVCDLAEAVLATERVSGSLVVAFVDEERMMELNGRYRALHQPTDVLSFRQADSILEWPDPTGGADTDLGEVVVCPAVVQRYACEEGGHHDTQLGWTIIHGILHLLGYDHELDEGQMREREQLLLAELDRQVKVVAAVAAVAVASAAAGK
jgi:probable rRNA maturation factor